MKNLVVFDLLLVTSKLLFYNAQFLLQQFYDFNLKLKNLSVIELLLAHLITFTFFVESNGFNYQPFSHGHKLLHKNVPVVVNSLKDYNALSLLKFIAKIEFMF